MAYAAISTLHWYGPAMASMVVDAVAEVEAAAKLDKRLNVDTTATATSEITLTNGRGSPLSVAAVATTEWLLKKRLGARLDVSIGAVPSAFDVSQAVWYGSVFDGFSASKIMEVLLAVAAGKTDIDLSGANPVVTFRNPADTLDRVRGTMMGSRRASVTII